MFRLFVRITINQVTPIGNGINTHSKHLVFYKQNKLIFISGWVGWESRKVHLEPLQLFAVFKKNVFA